MTRAFKWSLAAGPGVRAAPLLLLVMALAGCTVEPPRVEGRLPSAQAPDIPQAGAGPQQGRPDLDPNLTAEAVLLPAPVWVRGDAWNFNVAVGGQGAGATGSQRFVVYDETSTDYLIAATDPDDAAAQAFFGRSLPGRVNKQFLSGYDQGIGTRYLDFPLQTNKTWNLHVRSTDYLVKANFTRTLEGRGPGFAIDGASPAGDRVSLAYAPSAKWMTRFQLLDPRGQSLFQRTLTSHAANYTGPYYTAKAEDLFDGERNGTAAGQPPVDTFPQGRPYTTLHLFFEASGQGTADVRVVDPAGQLRFNFTSASTTFVSTQEADMPSAQGQWRVSWVLAGPVEASLRIAGIDIVEGTL